MIGNRKPRQDDVAVLMIPVLTRRRHHPSHSQRRADRFRLAGAGVPRAQHFLQRDDVGLDVAEHTDDAVRTRPSIKPARAMDVVGRDSELDPRPRHTAIIGDMAKLRTEYEVTCPCCQSTLVIDEGLRRVVRHVEPERADKPKIDEAHLILAEQKARRDALFEQSVQSEKTRGDALSKRFEEALKQASEEPVTKPRRDFDLD